MNYHKERKETAAYMRRLYNRNLTTCSGGNISCRPDKDRILITPSSLDKAYLMTKHIAILNAEGENLTPRLKTSIETHMHLEIFKNRPDVKAVVHAHPVHASLFTARDKVIRTDLLAEARYLLGDPVMAPYALMGTDDLAKTVGLAFKDPSVSVVLLENHGVITVGASLHAAYDKMEVLEAAAHMTYMGELLGDVKYLTEDRKKAIDQLHPVSPVK